MISARSQARLNLQVTTVNIALERQLLSLECLPVAKATFEFEINGYPAAIYLNDAEYQHGRG
jgi:hypothetical protein